MLVAFVSCPLYMVPTKLLQGALHHAFTRAPINRIMHLYDPSKTSQNCLFYLKLGSTGCDRASGDMVGSYVPNSDPWGCFGARVMVIFMFYVGPRFPNIEYFEVYGGI